jgi:methionyl-tRNA formyltransferase
MKRAIIGQQDFDKAVVQAFQKRGADVAAVLCAPEKPGAQADPLRAAAEERGLKVHQFEPLRGNRESVLGNGLAWRANRFFVADSSPSGDGTARASTPRRSTRDTPV